MIASNDDGRRYFAIADQFVHGDAELSSLAVSEPADARWQTLKMDALLRELDPAAEVGVFWEQIEDQFVCAVNVFGVARERHPAEWSFAFAKEGANVLGNEAGNDKSVFYAGEFGLRSQIVAVVEGDRTAPLQLEHRFDVPTHGFHRTPCVLFGVALAQAQCGLEAHAVGHISL